MGFFPVLRPIAVSEIIIGRHTVSEMKRYMSKKAAPPPFATSMGKRQILPKPTAAPADARINPIFPLKILDLFIKSVFFLEKNA